MRTAKRSAFDQIAFDEYGFFVEHVHHGKYEHGPHTLKICEALEKVERGEIKRLLICLPPRHSKSHTVTETFPAWYYGRKISRNVIVTSYGYSLAKKFGRRNRQKLEEFGQNVFGITLARDNKEVGDFSAEGGTGAMRFVGIGGTITGTGADLLVIDDPYKNKSEAESETIREKIWDEYQNSLLTRLSPGGAIILILTRWHADDLAGRILAQPGAAQEWHTLVFPAEAEENDPLGREVGAPLWPGRGFNLQWMERKKREVGAMTWASLYQQRPAPAEGNIIRRSWFNYWRELPALDEIIISIDAAFKDKRDSDFVVMQVWGRAGASKYLIDQLREKLSFTNTVAALRGLCAQYPAAHLKLIEDKANGTAIIDFLRHDIPGIVPVNPKESKTARAYAVQPTLEAGNVYLPAAAPWLQEFVLECTSFPNAAHDDQVDAMTQALSRFQENNSVFIGRA